MSEVEERLARMEVKLDLVVQRVSHVERKASFWGALSSIVVSLVSMIFGVRP